MIDFSKFYQLIAQSSLVHWLEILPAQLATWRRENLKGQFRNWQNVVDNLPSVTPQYLDLVSSITADNEALSDHQRQGIERLLRQLMPWRKGPYSLYGTFIDAEWRSDWKWERVVSYISPLANRLILDVGCGSGYHMWRMLGSQAKLVIGIDPTKLFLYQFEAIRKLLGNDQRAHLLPLRIEQLPRLTAFDTVFSMGVLYHCRSPFDHLLQLKNQLVNGGELVLETLVIEGNEQAVLVPSGRYAQMCNVWCIPSAIALQRWLEKCGFVDVHIVNFSRTTENEQRRTEWMITSSLSDFLDPGDCSKTLEGYPAPLRAVLIAHKP